MSPSAPHPSTGPNNIKVEIEKLVEGGMGLGHIGKKVVFVPFTLPNEKVEIKAVRHQKGYIKADPIHILSASLKRTSPPCPLFQRCGGCQLQHIHPDHQVIEKRTIFKETLQRIGKIPPSVILPAISSPYPLNYRNRCQVRVRYQEGRNIIGFNEFHTHRIVPVENCLLLNSKLNQTLQTLSKLLTGKRAIPNLRRIHIQTTHSENPPLLSLFCVGEFPYPLERLYQHFQSSQPLTGMVGYSQSGRQIFGVDFLSHPLGDLSLRAGDRTFVQIHWDLNQHLIHLLKQWMAPLKGKRILELYSGMGNFSLPLAQQGAEVIGLDENPSAIEDAIHNARQNKVSNCQFYTGNLNRGFPKHLKIRKKINSLLVDPPREGLSKNLLKEIIGLASPQLFYISCSPATLARDLQILSQNQYTVQRIQPVDLFPQTSHLEAIAHLERR